MRGRSSGRSSDALRQGMAYVSAANQPYAYIDTEYSSIQSGRLTEMYGYTSPGHSTVDYISPLKSDKDGMFEDLQDYMSYLIGHITREEYDNRSKLRSMKDLQKINNKEAKFVLEKEY
jgi:hypothetical protein